MLTVASTPSQVNDTNMVSNIILARSGDIDLPKIIFMVMFLLVGFVQWLIKLAKQKTEDRQRALRPPLTEEEKAMRRRGLERSLKKQISVRLPNATSIGGPMGEMLDALRGTMEPLPNPASVFTPQPQTTLTSQLPSAASSRRDAALAHPAFVPATPSGIMTRSSVSKQKHPVVQLLSNKACARQAVLMKEILGPPKALQNGSDALF